MVGLFEPKKKIEKWAVWTILTSVVYFENLVGYGNALRSRPGTYKDLELQRSKMLFV